MVAQWTRLYVRCLEFANALIAVCVGGGKYDIGFRIKADYAEAVNAAAETALVC